MGDNSRHQINRLLRAHDGPGWRAMSAERRAREPTSRASSGDTLIDDVAHYLILAAQTSHGSERAARKFPEIAEACALWRNEALAEPIKLFALADGPVCRVAERLGVSERIVELAESLFFDVRASLGATDWIATHVLHPAMSAGPREHAVRLKYAYYAGPFAAESILDATVRLPTTEVERLYDQDMLLYLKAQQALAAPLETAREREAFLEQFLTYDLARRKLDIEKQKFARNCEQERLASRMPTSGVDQAAAPDDVTSSPAAITPAESAPDENLSAVRTEAA